MRNGAVLEVQDLRVYFYTRWGLVKAVDGVTFDVRVGETLGIVGESGSGKSVTALSIMRLVPSPPGRIEGGYVGLNGVDILGLSEKKMQGIRGQRVAMIFQDPMTSLNPVFNIGNQVGETLRIHQRLRGKTLAQRVIDALRLVRIPAPETRVRDYPHQMSGGMRQRIVGAIASSCQPEVLIADEPTTSLDLTIQAQYLQLLKQLQQETGVGMIFITHDFGIVADVCDRVAVMYAGRIVEEGEVREIFNNPSHPYTQALLASLPNLDEKEDRLYSIEGQPPRLYDLPVGCSFAPRCPFAMDVCREEYPRETSVAAGHRASCWKLVEYERAAVDE